MDILWKATAFIVLLVFPKVFFTFSLIPFFVIRNFMRCSVNILQPLQLEYKRHIFYRNSVLLDAKVFLFCWNTIDCDL